MSYDRTIWSTGVGAIAGARPGRVRKWERPRKWEVPQTRRQVYRAMGLNPNTPGLYGDLGRSVSPGALPTRGEATFIARGGGTDVATKGGPVFITSTRYGQRPAPLPPTKQPHYGGLKPPAPPPVREPVRKTPIKLLRPAFGKKAASFVPSPSKGGTSPVTEPEGAAVDWTAPPSTGGGVVVTDGGSYGGGGGGGGYGGGGGGGGGESWTEEEMVEDIVPEVAAAKKPMSTAAKIGIAAGLGLLALTMFGE